MTLEILSLPLHFEVPRNAKSSPVPWPVEEPDLRGHSGINRGKEETQNRDAEGGKQGLCIHYIHKPLPVPIGRRREETRPDKLICILESFFSLFR